MDSDSDLSAGALKNLMLAAVVGLVMVLMAACRSPKPLPEQGSYAEQLYTQRCGSCHRAYAPSSMTAAMWQTQVQAMQAKIVQAGQPALSSEERVAIVNYLQRNAGKY
jgi:mono/diheme cytochrome c family protein